MIVENGVPNIPPKPSAFVNGDGKPCAVNAYNDASGHFEVQMGDTMLSVPFLGVQQMFLSGKEAKGWQSGEPLPDQEVRDILKKDEMRIVTACRNFCEQRLGKEHVRIMRAP